MIGGRDSSEVARDPRGFAIKFYTIKFYTEDGNWEVHVNSTVTVRWELSTVGDKTALTLTHNIDNVKIAAATVAPGDHPATIIARNGVDGTVYWTGS